jgi:hypothetical protein
VNEKWWDEVKASCPKPLEEERRDLFEVRLILTTIPYEEFDEFRQPNWGSEGNTREKHDEWYKEVISRQKSELSRFGWKLGSGDYPYTEHKYFNLLVREI